MRKREKLTQFNFPFPDFLCAPAAHAPRALRRCSGNRNWAAALAGLPGAALLRTCGAELLGNGELCRGRKAPQLSISCGAWRGFALASGRCTTETGLVVSRFHVLAKKKGPAAGGAAEPTSVGGLGEGRGYGARIANNSHPAKGFRRAQQSRWR